MENPAAAYALELALRAGEHDPPGRPLLNPKESDRFRVSGLGELL